MADGRPDRIKAVGVTHVYPSVAGQREVVAIQDLNMAVREGEFAVLLGPSGCGKSTFLYLCGGFITPTSGQVLLGGAPITGPGPNRGIVFQEFVLYPWKTVLGNIRFGLEIQKVPAAEMGERAMYYVRLAGLEGFEHAYPHTLSGGMKQRVALARALVKQPKLLLLDEPLGALDKKLREQTQFELVNIQDRTGVTFIVVTHDQEEAMTISSRIGVMNQGRIVQIGTPTEIYEFPNSRFVADFIGSVNMFSGRIVDEDNDYVRISSEEGACTIYINHGVAAPPDAELWVAVRPEKIHITREAPTDTRENCTQGVVQDIAYMGDLSIFNVRLETGKMVKVTQTNLMRHAEDRITWEDRVYLHWHPGSGVVLNT